MKRSLALVALVTLSACTPAGSRDDPRDRKGDVAAAPVWGVVRQTDGIAAFLARPGSAPDLVLWCRNNAEMTLRAHVFQSPPEEAGLFMVTPLARDIFLSVRQQGGVRKGDRTLVEGVGRLPDPNFQTMIAGADKVELRSGTETYRADKADPNKVMPGFVSACLTLPPPTHSPSWKSAK